MEKVRLVHCFESSTAIPQRGTIRGSAHVSSQYFGAHFPKSNMSSLTSHRKQHGIILERTHVSIVYDNSRLELLAGRLASLSLSSGNGEHDERVL